MYGCIVYECIVYGLINDNGLYGVKIDTWRVHFFVLLCPLQIVYFKVRRDVSVDMSEKEKFISFAMVIDNAAVSLF